MYNLSLIIPAYNAQDTIVETLDSIYSVGLPNGTFEVIVIDDCSTDNTVSIVNEYSKTHYDIILLCQSFNQRQGAARNRGLKIAQGQYIALVDSDDIIAPGLIKTLDRALCSDVDVMHCGMITQRNLEDHFVASTAPKNKVLPMRDFLENWHTIDTCQSPCAYLYKNELLQQSNVHFVEGKRLEDTDWVEKNLYACKTIMCTDDVIYVYRENTTSTMHTTNFDTCADWWHFSYRRLIFSKNIQNDVPAYAMRLKEAAIWGIKANTTFRRLSRFSALDYIKIRKRCGKECLKYLSSNFKWTGFTKIAIMMPLLAFTCILVAHPLATLGRKIVQAKRKLLYR